MHRSRDGTGAGASLVPTKTRDVSRAQSGRRAKHKKASVSRRKRGKGLGVDMYGGGFRGSAAWAAHPCRTRHPAPHRPCPARVVPVGHITAGSVLAAVPGSRTRDSGSPQPAHFSCPCFTPQNVSLASPVPGLGTNMACRPHTSSYL